MQPEFGQGISRYIILPWHVAEIEAIEVALEFSDFRTVCVHHFLGAIPIFVDLIDNHRGVSVDN